MEHYKWSFGTTVFARKCDATGKGMNEGYCVGDGELYFSDRQHMIDHLRTLNWEDWKHKNSPANPSDEELLEFFHIEGYCYYTEWTFDEVMYDGYYYDENGNEIDFI
jgi:hypothetical protein